MINDHDYCSRVGVNKLCFYFGPLCFIFMLKILTYYAFPCTHYAFFYNDYAFLQTIILNADDYNAVKKSRKCLNYE